MLDFGYDAWLRLAVATPTPSDPAPGFDVVDAELRLRQAVAEVAKAESEVEGLRKLLAKERMRAAPTNADPDFDRAVIDKLEADLGAAEVRQRESEAKLREAREARGGSVPRR